MFPLPGKLALLACRPSRELVDFLVFSNAREGEINLCTGDQREVSQLSPIVWDFDGAKQSPAVNIDRLLQHSKMATNSLLQGV